MKHTTSGKKLKEVLPSAVIIGRDRQSDNLSYRLCAKPVQRALKEAAYYQFRMIPEQIFDFKTVAHSHSHIRTIQSVMIDCKGDILLSAVCKDPCDPKQSLHNALVSGKRSKLNLSSFNSFALLHALEILS